MSVETAPRMNYEKAGQQFATVSIPDLRNQQLQMIREDARTGLPPLATINEKKLDDSVNVSLEASENDAGTANENIRVTDDECSSTSFENETELEPLVNSIVEHYPAGGTPIISIAASEANPQLATTVARAAHMLQKEAAGKILLIDSDFDDGGLTYQMNCVGKSGLAELVGDEASWNECTCQINQVGIDFVPIGRTTLRQSADIYSWIGRTLPVFKEHYDYVLVCSGEAHTDQSTAWCGHASGSYLIVSMMTSNQSIAKSAVTHLQSHGARILGCVVSDCS